MTLKVLYAPNSEEHMQMVDDSDFKIVFPFSNFEKRCPIKFKMFVFL